LEDVERSYRWLLASGVSDNSLVVAGDSAGGGLTLALLLRLRDSGAPLPSSAVLFSPWTDLTGSGASVRENDGKCTMFRQENIPAFAACYAPPVLWMEPGVSPLFGRFDGLPPVLVQAAAEELLRDDAVRLHDRLRSAGVRAELAVYDGVFHGWQMLDGIVPEARQSLEQAARFMRASAIPDHRSRTATP
jgi:acetyl esterase/lipase